MKIIDFIFNIFFPKRCTFCSSVIGFISRCPDCDPEEFRLPSCLLVKQHQDTDKLDGIAALYSYDGCVSGSIVRVKHFNDSANGNELSLIYANEFPDYLFDNIDCLLRVPDYKEREYSLSENLLSALAKQTGIPRTDAIIKTIDTKKQHKLELKERRKNLSGAFKCLNSNAVSGKTILIVDDVVTTGNTMNEIAAVLKRVGATKVYGYAFASTGKGRKSKHKSY